MQAYYLFIVFILGLFFGSFFNVVIFQLESKDSKQLTGNSKQERRENLKGRSFCPSCKHQLRFFDLIPLFSWIFLRARCRYCKKPISIQYPLVELTTGLLFILTYLFTVQNSQITWYSPTTYSISTYVTFLSFVLLLTVNCLLLIVFVYDLKHKIIPDKVIYPAIVLGVSYLLLVVSWEYLSGNPVLLTSNLYPLLSAFGAGGFFNFLAAVSDGKWMGGGDIKLVFLIGLLLSFPKILPAMFIGFISGAVVGVTLIVMGKKKLQSEIPFGPFLITGAWIALFWGNKVVEWYLRAFL